MFRLRIVAIIRELQYYKDRRPAYRMSVNGKYPHITFFYIRYSMCGVTKIIMYIFHTDIQHATYVLVIVRLPDEGHNTKPKHVGA
jgi:hypothetical protein